MNAITTNDFQTTLHLQQTPIEVYHAIQDVRGWWSQEVEGNTEDVGSIFNYHYSDVHRSEIKIVESVPGKLIKWEILDNEFNFVKDKTEWIGNTIVFELEEKDGGTLLKFTQHGLVPEYECFEICADAWTKYIHESLGNLVKNGKGFPNAKEDYHTSITIDATAEQTFEAINNVRAWWTENLEGNTHAIGDKFTVTFGDVHVSTQEIMELQPNKKVVWLVSNSRLNFVEKKNEWDETKICFEITSKGNKTVLQFTHFGLLPALQCYKDCSPAWHGYIHDSLKQLITKGKGNPEKKVNQ